MKSINCSIIFPLILVLFSCEKSKNFDHIKIIGHGGAGLENLSHPFHDNSEEAINYALSFSSCDGVEVDGRFSKDFDLWLYHDEKLDTESDYKGCVSNLHSQELSLIRYYNSKQKLLKFENYNWKKFDQKEIFIDYKLFNSCTNSYNPSDTIMEKVKELYLKYNNEYKIRFIINQEYWAQQFNQYDLPYYFSVDNYDTALKMLTYDKIQGFLLKKQQINTAMVQHLKSLDKKVLIFDVRSSKAIRESLEMNPDYIFVDDLQKAIIEKY